MQELIPLTTGPVEEVGSIWTVHAVLEMHPQARWDGAYGGLFADFSLRLEPYADSEGTLFRDAMPIAERHHYVSLCKTCLRCNESEGERIVQEYVDHVMEGIRDALQEMAQEGVQIIGLLIILTGLSFHPLGSRPHLYQGLANMYVRRSLQGENLTLLVAQERLTPDE